jgi:hypothetical protein
MANGLFNLKQVVQAVQQGGWPAQKTPAVEYLVVAGGGSGGSVYGGGGGAGGLLQGIDPVPNGQALLVTVGAGGTGSGSSGNVGGASVFGNISAAGGGGGSTSAGNGATSGGSGGGGGQGVFFTTQGVAGQGNGGGQSSGGGNGYGGGGGGAGAVGLSYANNGGGGSSGGRGGAGIASAISGTVTAYAGGGGGGTLDAVSQAGLGGAGGGGNGGGSNLAATAGTANTGGGGGGAYNATSPAGGSGVVIVSYPDVYAAATSTTGSPTVSTSGSGSVYLSSSYFTYNGQSSFAFGTGDFTIEFWFYALSLSSTPVIYDSRPTGGNGAYAMIYFDGSAPKFYVNTTDSITGSALSTSTWYHLAVSRSGTVTKMFINGSQVGSSYTDTTNYLNSSARPSVGTNGASLGSNNLGGYISNLRILKGTALYTSNFTVPTAPLTAVTNTQLLLNAVSGAYLADGSTNSYNPPTVGGSPAWNTLSPFTVTGYKNRVYTWTSSGSITF